MLANRIPHLLATVKANADYLKRNRELLDIYGGNLKPYVIAALKTQLSGGAFSQAVDRVPPINVLTRIVNKLSQIYTPGVSRQVVPPQGKEPREADVALLGWYEAALSPSLKLALANRYFNLFKNTLIWPTVIKGKPTIRVVPSDRFVPFGMPGCSDADGVILCLGKRPLGKKGADVECYEAMDDASFVYFTDEGQDVTAFFVGPDEMAKAAAAGVAVGAHTLGRKPFVYVSADPNNVVPTEDSDTLAMTKLLPILLTDINFAHKFQAFSIIYGINVTDAGLTWSPNAFWQFNSTPGADSNAQPQIGTLQPNTDVRSGLELVASQFAFWLNTRGIKPGAIGEVNATNFASGIAKLIDEMDTSENRNEQVPHFQRAEVELWDLILKAYHPTWSKLDGFGGPRDEFTDAAAVSANFAEQVPLVRRGQVVGDAKAEIDAGFTTRRRALKRINPTMTESQITDLEKDIDAERAAGAPVAS